MIAVAKWAVSSIPSGTAGTLTPTLSRRRERGLAVGMAMARGGLAPSPLRGEGRGEGPTACDWGAALACTHGLPQQGRAYLP